MERSTARYHHGSLRRALLDRTAEVIDVGGLAAVTMRSLAADLGVSHTAAAHHFGSRAGLLAAFAAEGYDLMAEALSESHQRGDFLGLGLAYVDFAVSHPSYFMVMFDRHEPDFDDPTLMTARDRALGMLRAGADGRVMEAGGDAAGFAIAAWSMMHGLARLKLDGVLDDPQVQELLGGSDFMTVAERAARLVSPDGGGQGAP